MKTTKKYMAALVVLVLAIAAFALTLKPEKVSASAPTCYAWVTGVPWMFTWQNGCVMKLNGRTLGINEIEEGFVVHAGDGITIEGCCTGPGFGDIITAHIVKNTNPPTPGNTDTGGYDTGMSSRSYGIIINCNVTPPTITIGEATPNYCN